MKRAAETLGLGTLLDRKPSQLSGGQRQRVALARAIVREPLVFLMDEPLSNLDAALRVQTRAEIVELQSRLSTTTLYVTHDQVEAMTMGHRIAVMSEGKLQQVAPPEDLYARPANAFVAHFLGSPGHEPAQGMLVESARAPGDPEREAGTLGTLSWPSRVPRCRCRRRWPTASAAPGPTSCSGCVPRRCASAPDGSIAATVILVELLGAETHVICQTENGRARSSSARGRARPSPGWARPFASRSTPIRRRTTSSTPPPVSVSGTCRDDGGRRQGAKASRGSRERRGGRARRRAACAPDAAGRRSSATSCWSRRWPLFIAFSFYPFLRNFKLMLYETPPVPGVPARFVGLSQIIPTITSTQFTQSLVTTIIFVVLVVPISLLLGLLLAVAAHRKLKGIAVYRVIFSSTVVSSVAVASVIFGTLLNPVVGFLPWLGINPNPPALESTTWALPAVALISIWQFLGLSFIIMLAGLQTVPDELLEAARIDGAGAWTRFWRMTVPLLSPTIFFAVVVGTIFAFQAFGAIDILITSENAVRLHTNVLIYNIINTLQVDNNPGAAAIMATVLFLLLLGLTVLQMRFLERRVHYAR